MSNSINLKHLTYQQKCVIEHDAHSNISVWCRAFHEHAFISKFKNLCKLNKFIGGEAQEARLVYRKYVEYHNPRRSNSSSLPK